MSARQPVGELLVTELGHRAAGALIAEEVAVMAGWFKWLLAVRMQAFR